MYDSARARRDRHKLHTNRKQTSFLSDLGMTAVCQKIEIYIMDKTRLMQNLSGILLMFCFLISYFYAEKNNLFRFAF